MNNKNNFEQIKFLTSVMTVSLGSDDEVSDKFSLALAILFTISTIFMYVLLVNNFFIEK